MGKVTGRAVPVFGNNLPDRYRKILETLDRRDEVRDGFLSTKEIAWACGLQFAGSLHPHMSSLHRWGYAEKHGVAFDNARCWSITPAGRAALKGD